MREIKKGLTFFRRWRNERSPERSLAQRHTRTALCLLWRQDTCFRAERSVPVINAEVSHTITIEVMELSGEKRLNRQTRLKTERLDPQGLSFPQSSLQSTRNKRVMFCEIRMRQENVYLPGLIGQGRAEVCLPRSPQPYLQLWRIY